MQSTAISGSSASTQVRWAPSEKSVATPIPAGGGDVQATVAAAPVETANPVEATTKAPEPDQVKDALKAINDTMNAMSRNLEFSYDADVNRMVVTVVDQQTKEVIQQMPTKEALEIAKALDKVQGLLFRQKA